MPRPSRFRLLSGLRSSSRTSIAVGGGVVLAVVAVTVGLTPGISVGVLSNPVAPLIVPPATTRLAVNTAVPVTTETPATALPTTSAPAKSPVPPPTVTANAVTTTAVASGSGSVRIAAGSARQGRTVTIQASGLRPNEVVSFTIGGRKITAKADSRGQARISYTVPKTATSLLVKAAAISGTRSASVAVRPR